MKSILLLVLFLPTFSLAFPVAPELDLDAPLELLRAVERDFDFNGIVALSNCSGSLVHFAGQPLSSQAYVLSNGHCLGGFFGFPKPGEVRYKQRDNRRMNAFININKKVRIQTDQLVYGTMTDTDASLFRLKQTYQELLDQGVESFEMNAVPPLINEDIQIISGYHRKGFECSIENFVHNLKEGDWTMVDSVRYSPIGCEVYGGTSGSPVIKKDERLVVAVNNTGNESGQKCTNNNPCEVSAEGKITVIKGRGYAQQTYWFATCLNTEFDIDLNRQGCLLPKPQ